MDSAVARPTTVKQSEVPFLEYPSQHQQDTGRRQCLVFMIPGNPGLIAYYEPFLRTLRQLLDEREAREGCQYAFHIYGRNLLGFDDRDHEPAFGTPTAVGGTTEPFTLEDQIRCLCEQVQQVNSSTLPLDPAAGVQRSFDVVVLIGHSVGAYIALEIFNRHHHQARSLLSSHPPGAASSSFSPASSSSSPPSQPSLALVPLKSAVLLFPTVSHIARSRSGQKLDLIRRTPVLARSAHRVAKAFVGLWPAWVLDAAVRRLLGYPDHAAAATTRFLASRDGIWQALFMGQDEMATIGEERWGEELWEIREVEGSAGGGDRGVKGAKFVFYFAERDHWVADECRDEFIERRRRHENGRTEILIDEENIPHAFCIHHSETVAEKVKLWLEDFAGL
ncbi:hypothetical protein VTK26DRAFT_2968 [Humicola hyalothermophila]